MLISISITIGLFLFWFIITSPTDYYRDRWLLYFSLYLLACFFFFLGVYLGS